MRYLFCLALVLGGCEPKAPTAPLELPLVGPPDTAFHPDTLFLSADSFPPLPLAADNPVTTEGVALGRRLFHDPRLSGDSTQSCASCHAQAFAFSDHGARFSTGIDGVKGTLNAPAIINPGWGAAFFWDGRAATLEAQALQPVVNPTEMHTTWPGVVQRLRADSLYPEQFRRAFGTAGIDSLRAVKAIAQFERTFISNHSKFDAVVLRKQGAFTASEARGFYLFTQTERADCFHCHPAPLFTDNRYHNTGLDSVIAGTGLGGRTGNPGDDGLWKTPTLRNAALTAPYMHDGRLATLAEAVEHYESGIVKSATLDPLIDNRTYRTGAQKLSDQEKLDIIAFLLTLTDSAFAADAQFLAP